MGTGAGTTGAYKAGAPVIGRPDRPDHFHLGMPPDSRGRDPDTSRNLQPAVQRQLDEAGVFEAGGDFARARAEYTRMTASGDRQTKAAGAIALGLMLVRHTDPAGALAAYSLAADTKDPDLAPLAMLYSGQALRTAGDLSAAGKAFQAAAQTRHPDHAPPAAYYLAKIGEVTGQDPVLLAELYVWVVDSGHPGVWPLAAVDLATILNAGGMEDPALKLLRRVLLESGHREARVKAALLVSAIMPDGQ